MPFSWHSAMCISSFFDGLNCALHSSQVCTVCFVFRCLLSLYSFFNKYSHTSLFSSLISTLNDTLHFGFLIYHLKRFAFKLWLFISSIKVMIFLSCFIISRGYFFIHLIQRIYGFFGASINTCLYSVFHKIYRFVDVLYLIHCNEKSCLMCGCSENPFFPLSVKSFRINPSSSNFPCVTQNKRIWPLEMKLP